MNFKIFIDSHNPFKDLSTEQDLLKQEKAENNQILTSPCLFKASLIKMKKQIMQIIVSKT